MPKMLVTVYQVKDERTREFGFMGLDELRKNTGKQDIDMSVYDVVFGERDVEGTTFYAHKVGGQLERLYITLNDPHILDAAREHFGYKGRSMSLSDIVQINGTFYYCDVAGWEPIKCMKNVPNWIYVGMGASGTYFSDLTPFEVTRITPSGKTVYIRKMDSKRIGSNHQIGDRQEYEYTSNPDAHEEAVRKHKDGQWKTASGMYIAFGSARRYYDPQF